MKKAITIGLLMLFAVLLWTTGAMAEPLFNWPVDTRFYYRSDYYYGKVNSDGSKHTGIDIMGTNIEGEPIYSPISGTANYYYRTSDGKLSSYGNFVEISSGSVVFRLCHMSKLAFGLTTPMGNAQTGISGGITHDIPDGQNIPVKEGDVVGYVGKAGNATGPHVHVELYIGGNIVNPLNYLDATMSAKDAKPSEDTSYLTDPLVFNVSWYKAHADKAVQDMTDAQAIQHWINIGIAEGRPSSPVFDVTWYLGKNSDVKTDAYFGVSNQRAIEHFLKYGSAEFRDTSPSFNAQCYKDNYLDLQNAYGNNAKKYYEHYNQWGEAEGRIANERFHVKYVDANGKEYANAPQKLLTEGVAFGTLYAPTQTGYTLSWKDQTGRTVTKDTICAYDPDVAEIVLKANWTPIQYMLDVNGRLDGQDKGNVSGFGTFDLTVGSAKTRDDDYDAYDKINYGTKYAITDIRPTDTAKYKYVGICEGSASGTITGATNVRLDFHSLYGVTFNKNTTDTVSNMPANTKKEWSVNLTLSGTAPSRANYTFVAWNTKADGTGTSYAVNSVYSKNEAVTLYAIWTPIQYMLDVNGRLDGQDKGNVSGFGTFDLTVGSAKTRDDDYDAYDKINYGTKYAITDIKPTDTAKYKYVGICEGNASGTITGATNVRLDFHSLYGVTFNKNTTDPVSNMPRDTYKEWSVNLTLPTEMPTRVGYTFMRWMDKEGNAYSPGAVYRTNAPLTLLAVWGKDGQEMESGGGRIILDGDYEIRASFSMNSYMDISGSEIPARESENVVLNTSADTLNPCDVWTVRYLNNGFYSIMQKGTDLALSVAGDSLAYRGNVQVNKYEGKASQQWSITEASTGSTQNGFRIVSRNSGLSIDVQGAAMNAGDNIHQWEANTNINQTWVFIPSNPAKTIADGRYILLSSMSDSLELDVAGDRANIPNGQNVQVWNEDDTFHTEVKSQYNSFDVVYLGDGYYKLINACSGKALTVSEANTLFSQNVFVSDYTGAKSQQWAIVQNGGAYVLLARCSGYSLHVQDAAVSNGANVVQHGHHTQPNESWRFVQAEYAIRYDVGGGRETIPDQLKYYMGDIQLSDILPTGGGWLFDGWATEKDAAAAYQPGDTFSLDQDTVLYAVWKSPDLLLPDHLASVEEEAFTGSGFTSVLVPATVREIGSRAFADCANLKHVFFVGDDISIAKDAFSGSNELVIHCHENSDADWYARRYGFETDFMD